MHWNGTYEFDRGLGDASLFPMAALRAFDVAGIHVLSSAWNALSEQDRRQFAALGSAFRVSFARVAAFVCKLGVVYRMTDPMSEPTCGQVPRSVSAALGEGACLTVAEWDSLLPLDRYTLAKLADQGSDAKVRVAYREITRRQSGGAPA